MICPECYSNNPRITPILNPEQCLRNHLQYICSTCGRCICIEKGKNDRMRWKFPFKSLEIAKLYLKTAEITCKSLCGIYKLKRINNRFFYKIFNTKDDLIVYLNKNTTKTSDKIIPVYISKKYIPIKFEQIKRLSKKDVIKYMNEKTAYTNGD